jgi:hypothetical protein
MNGDDTRIGTLSDDDLDTVVGGTMDTGIDELLQNLPAS